MNLRYSFEEKISSIYLISIMDRVARLWVDIRYLFHSEPLRCIRYLNRSVLWIDLRLEKKWYQDYFCSRRFDQFPRISRSQSSTKNEVGWLFVQSESLGLQSLMFNIFFSKWQTFEHSSIVWDKQTVRGSHTASGWHPLIFTRKGNSFPRNGNANNNEWTVESKNKQLNY